ncbi:BPSL0067 family protein [Massilia psychrophila]|uniref:BPSL0067 family protein n=1 Tax=Massilia psychrophila TaxID=1603353 RepID=UPI00199F3978|nr:BPSL0067 family protein [Massilia psychrophila]GGE60017.1 hypothetical protein GCM10008020_00020 [Massilia psychrophila]
MAYVALDPEKFKGSSVGNGHCVAYARQATSMPHTGVWRKGALVKGTVGIAIGTAIATFDKNNSYANKVDGTSHVAIYLGQTAVGI